MRATPEPVVIACAANAGYALPLAVTLRSALTHLTPDRTLEVFVIDDGVAADDKARVERSLGGRASLHWLRPQRSAFSGLPLWGRMPVTTYDKLLIAELLPPTIGRTIWLDCDLLVLRDVAPLWNAGTAGHHALAACDPRVRSVSSTFGVAGWAALALRPDAPYFNAGVMVVDCALWRRDGVSERALSYLKRHRDRVFFWDQEALNAVLAERWGEIDPRWNCPPDARPDPWILHFSGNLKPWALHARRSHHALYYRYVDDTAWRGWRPPRAWRSLALTLYESSPARRRLYRAEQWAMRLLRRLTLHYAEAT